MISRASTWGLLQICAIVSAGILTTLEDEPLDGLGARPFKGSSPRVANEHRLWQHPTDCTMVTFQQEINHPQISDSGRATFPQRYCVNDTFWKVSKPGPIFFYTGNEGDVTTYIENTGLMWENAEEFGAMLVFAEHRFYGKSLPCDDKGCLYTLNTEQAMMDYANLIVYLQDIFQMKDAPVIAFGGSYGGMLSAWMRFKYPHLIKGAIAASAPVLAFPGLMTPEFRPDSYWKIVTDTARKAAEKCPQNVHQAIEVVMSRSKQQGGSRPIAASLGICPASITKADMGLEIAYWIQGAFDTLAMGNYPFPTSYINGDADHPLPAWPMTEACKYLSGEMTDEEVLPALRQALGVVYNASQDQDCYTLAQTGPAAGADMIWDYQFCTEMLPQELPYWPSSGPPNDMFWNATYTQINISRHCMARWGRIPDRKWMRIRAGSFNEISNIVFTNGEYDPWTSGGIRTSISSSTISIDVPKGAHHLDLMFSTKFDPPELKKVREKQMEMIKKWIE